MNLDAVQAVIDSAESRGTESLQKLIRRRMPDASDEDVVEAAGIAMDIIESVPAVLSQASDEARERNMGMLVQPVLDHAERYFLQPVDLLPEMTHGLAGLLDDAYLVLRILQNLDRGPTPFLDWDLDYPVTFIRGLLGERMSRELDAISIGAMQEISEGLSELWHHMAHEA